MKSLQKRQGGYTLVELLIAIGMALSLCGVVAGIWVLAHFVRKFW